MLLKPCTKMTEGISREFQMVIKGSLLILLILIIVFRGMSFSHSVGYFLIFTFIVLKGLCTASNKSGVASRTFL